VGRLRCTPSGEIKGKLAYISPEQLRCDPVDRRVDIYGAAAVLWEISTGMSLFDGPNESAIVHRVLHAEVLPPSAHRPELPPALDAITLRGLSPKAHSRYWEVMIYRSHPEAIPDEATHLNPVEHIQKIVSKADAQELALSQN